MQVKNEINNNTRIQVSHLVTIEVWGQVCLQTQRNSVSKRFKYPPFAELENSKDEYTLPPR